MAKKQIFITYMLLCSVLSSFAQNSNIFHDRSFWKSNPSRATINNYITQGHDITSLNNNAFDAVSWALIEKTDNETIKYLLTFEGNGVNKLTHDGRTYIFWAAYKGNVEMMQYLIDNGAKTDIVDDHGNTVLNFAASTGQTSLELYQFLFKHGSDVTKEKNHDGANALLLVSPYLENFNLIELLVGKGAQLNNVDSNGYGIFDYAAKGGNIQFLKLLLAKGLLKETSKKKGWPVVLASQGTRGHRNGLAVYKFLESLGVSLTGSNNHDRTALHYIASRDKDLALFNYFLERGLSVNQKDKDGNTPFLNAARSNTIDVVKTMRKHVEDINLTNDKGQSALTRAVERNNNDVVAYLLQEGCNIAIKDRKDNSLAYYLIVSYSPKGNEVFESKLNLLTNQGLDLTETQANGNSLLHLAVEKDNLNLIKRISKLGIDINLKNSNGLTSLHLAAMKADDKDILKYLLSIGADKNMKTDFDETVYDLASENELLQKSQMDITFLK